MAVGFSNTNKPINPRGLDASPKGYNRAALYSGKALDFDGVNDSISVADSDDLDGFTNFTYSVIAKADSTPNYCRLFDKGLDTLLGAFNLSDQLYLYVNSTAINFDYVLKLNEYLHFTIVFTGGQDAKLYVNGVLEETKTHSIASTGTNSTNFAIGSNNALNGNVWDGHMSNARLFNTALTAAQVADLYNNPEKIVPTGVADSALKLWLPMMEGAGTTAYDGSGNGNHGTISGATYVNGVGAPVAQSAVIDWNKGQNYQVYSEDFSNADWQRFDCSVTANDTTAPDGQTTADKVAFNASASARVSDTYTTSTSNNKTHTVSVWAKVASGTEQFRLKCTHQGVADYFSSDLTATTEWQRFTFSPTFGASAGGGIITAVQNATDGAAREIFFWGFQLDFDSSTAGPYIPTLSTAQTTPVLLPQGLTSGRDITGVNLFENVRKQGALNLDGNSWAEVHDNASVDLTTNFSLEVWCYPTEDGHIAGRELIGKFISSGVPYQCWVIEYKPNQFNFAIGATDNTFSGIASTTGKTKENWYHVVATYDGANRKIYVNGVAENSEAFTKTPQTTDKNIAIGRWLGQAVGGTNTFFGPIAQPRIYNRALTAEEVLRNYNSEKNTYQ